MLPSPPPPPPPPPCLRNLQEEPARRPELCTYFETVFPFQRQRRLIGTQSWEHKLGIGPTRGFRWGTLSLRTSAECSGSEGKIDAGACAIQYLKRLSPVGQMFSF